MGAVAFGTCCDTANFMSRIKQEKKFVLKIKIKIDRGFKKLVKKQMCVY